MQCKFCAAQLEEGMLLCPVCGQENVLEELPVAEPEAEVSLEVTEGEAEEIAVTEDDAEEIIVSEEQEVPVEPEKKKSRVGLWILTIVSGLVALVMLVLSVCYLFDVDLKSMLKPAANDIHCKESYSVADEEAAKWSDKVIATAGDMKLTNAELQMYYWSSVIDFLNNYSYYLSSMGLDYTQPLDSQMYFDQEMTWEQFFLENALLTWHKYAVLIQAANSKGYELTADEQGFLEALPERLNEMVSESDQYTTVQELLNAEMGAVCTEEGYLGYMRNYTWALGYFDQLYTELSATDEEVEEYFNENADTLAASGITKEGKYYDVRHILIPVEGGTQAENGSVTYSDEDWDACKASAEELLALWQKDYGTEDGFAQLAMTYSTDGGSSSNGGLYTDLTSETNFVEEFKEWYLDESRQVGDTGLVKSVYGYHIMYFSASRDIWPIETRNLLMQERSNDAVSALMEECPMQITFKNIALGVVDLG